MKKHPEKETVAALTAKIKRLEETIALKDRFLATVSHEIRSPMNGVFGMADALSRTELDGKQRRYLSVLRDSCDIMLSLANQLLEKGKMEAGQTTLVPVDFDVGDFASSVVETFSGQAANSGLLLELDTKILIDSRIRFDKQRLSQVLSNLISNALRYTDHGRIVVRIILQLDSDGQRHMILSVEDSGIGIRHNKHGKIFEAFASADPAESARRGGTGLGLSVVKDLVSLMGGTIRVDSTPGLGSTFTVDLVVEAAQSPKEPIIIPRRNMPKNLHILLAEDNDSNAFVFEVLLEDASIRITRVRNGEEAVIAFSKGNYDIIFMDIQMPVLNGIEAATAIRAAEGAAELPVPIIALSADIVASQCNEYKAARFSDALAKPMRQKELLDKIAGFNKVSG
ncbi:MAG: ATP-binding protein [Rhodobacteraceae bacterium]|nr:ATP-binding protein [Paracoccaceae bacterium]